MPNQGKNSVLTPRRITLFGAGINLLLSGAKIFAGIAFHSQAVLADGIHSLSDLITDAAVLIGLRQSSKPADSKHNYGHRRVSTIIALFVGMALLLVAGAIAAEAIETINHLISSTNQSNVEPTWPLIAALATIPSKELLYQLTKLVGKRYGDPSLIANAWHHRSDALSSVATSAGLAGVVIAGPGYAFLDPITAILVAGFLVAAGVKIIRQSTFELTDAAPPEDQITRIKEIIKNSPGVCGFHALRARTLAGQIELDFHITVDPNLTVWQGHKIAADLRKWLRAANPKIIQAIIHVEPDPLRNLSSDTE